ncbi:hypothetical protein EV126DRAFT_226850 [Verticillium dahliae]|nr:hypothetical protein EV126DRAFT_226850 [Verticillium dahliae]
MASSVRLVGHMHSRTPSDLTKYHDKDLAWISQECSVFSKASRSSRRGPRQNHTPAHLKPGKTKARRRHGDMKDTHLRTNHHSQKSGQGIVRTPCAHGTWPPVFTPSPDCATADVKTRDSLETSKEQAPLPCPKPVHDTMKSRVPKLRAVDVGSSVGRQHVRGAFRVIPEVGRRNGSRGRLIRGRGEERALKGGSRTRQSTEQAADRAPRERGRKRKSRNEETAGGRRGGRTRDWQ